MSGNIPIAGVGVPAHPIEAPKPKPEIARAAREFEAIFLRKMLTSLEKASHVGKPGGLSSGSDMYSSMMVGALADAVANAGGIGLANYVTHSLAPHPPPARPLPPAAAPQPSLAVQPRAHIDESDASHDPPQGSTAPTVHIGR